MRYPYFHVPAPAAPALSASERALTHKPDQKLLELLLAALRDEAQAAAGYTALAQNAPAEAAALLLPLAADELRHAAYLRELYETLTNQPAPERFRIAFRRSAAGRKVKNGGGALPIPVAAAPESAG